MPNPDPAPLRESAPSPPRGADGALPLIDLPASGPQDQRPGISDATPQELLSWFADHGESAFRARQLADHVWSGRAQSFDDIHTLPGPLRHPGGFFAKLNYLKLPPPCASPWPSSKSGDSS